MFSFCGRGRRINPAVRPPDGAEAISAPIPTCCERTALYWGAVIGAHWAYQLGLFAALGGIVTGSLAAQTGDIALQNSAITLFKVGFMTASVPPALQQRGWERFKRILEVLLLIGAGAVPWIDSAPPAVSGVLTLPIPYLVASSFPGFTPSSKGVILIATILGLISGSLSFAARNDPEKMYQGVNVLGASISGAFSTLAFGDKPMTPRNFCSLSLESQINFLCMLVSASISFALLSQNTPLQLVCINFAVLALGAACLNLELMQLTRATKSTETKVRPMDEMPVTLDFT